ncbi:hypothetical protein RU97_GL001612 [Enterococcus canis]|uniref:Uncharacterized protein n=1 Tax=Enterococcus canis TaxID=214095 RepID=A0A1L8RGX7_9ENTE|nr:CRISPR-associated protein Csn2-St [Enterococcus canis]OJG18994.1 hypothetical protein RU97_GL001612 [Enterococcus canis]
MEIAIEYERGNYLEFEGENYTFILGANHEIKWKLYRGLKRFSTGKSLSDLEENVYGDDGIVIKCNDKKMKAKDLPIYFLDCRESFLEQYRYTKGSLIQKYIDKMEDSFEINRQIEKLNDSFIQLEIELQDSFSKNLVHVIPNVKPASYQEMVKHFLQLSFYEDNTDFPVEMMDIEKLIDDYCTLIKEEILRTQKNHWLWINNPNAFISKKILSKFICKLRKVSDDTSLLHIFIMSDDYLELSYEYEDISNTVLLYERYQQLPDFENFCDSLARYYPDELCMDNRQIIQSLYRIFPYVGYQSDMQEVYLKNQDMVLLKVVSQLLNCASTVKCTDLERALSILEHKFLVN